MHPEDTPPHHKQSHTWLWVLVFIACGLLLFFILRTAADSQNEAEQQPTTTEVARYKYELANDESVQQDSQSPDRVNLARLKQRIVGAQSKSLDTSQMAADINAVLSANSDVTFGVAITDLATGTIYTYGNTGAMTAASVTKVLTAVAYLKQVELGNRSLDTVMSNGYTAQYNMEQMIVVSNNDAWHVLNDNIGYPQLQDYAYSIGLTTYDYTDNTISSGDTARLFGDLYLRKLINESNTQLLLSYMERANYRDLIIPAVPTTDTVYHKAGEYLVNLNDAAVITNGTSSIVLSIYTESNGSYSKSRIAGLMQQITTPALTTFQLN